MRLRAAGRRRIAACRRARRGAWLRCRRGRAGRCGRLGGADERRLGQRIVSPPDDRSPHPASAHQTRVAAVTDIAISLTLNGKTHHLAVAPHLTLADLLRERFSLTGCKVGCDEGVCGACTVIVNGAPVAACNTFAFAVDGRSVMTIEGLA